jgi:putative phosphoribosyl transferase
MFANRQEAGRELAARLAHLRGESPVVLGLPRGGVVVAAEIARSLGAPLDVLVVRKIPAPNQPELALGAVTDGAEPRTVLNHQIVAALHVPSQYLERAIVVQLDEVRRRQALYREGRSPPALTGHTLIVADDGIATGATVAAGLEALRQARPSRLVLAVPVGPPETLERLRASVDELVCLAAPPHFAAVGAFYEDFRQTSDAEVVALLRELAAKEAVRRLGD